MSERCMPLDTDLDATPQAVPVPATPQAPRQPDKGQPASNPTPPKPPVQSGARAVWVKHRTLIASALVMLILLLGGAAFGYWRWSHPALPDDFYVANGGWKPPKCKSPVSLLVAWHRCWCMRGTKSAPGNCWRGWTPEPLRHNFDKHRQGLQVPVRTLPWLRPTCSFARRSNGLRHRSSSVHG